MIDYDSIQNTLKRLNAEYNACNDEHLPVLFSKLAVLEFCGWIETSIDNILITYVDNTIVKDDTVKRIKEIINQNYGFKYNKNLFPLFCSVLGIKNYEIVIGAMSDVSFENFKSLLGTYSIERDSAAHTDTPKGTTKTYKAPSSVLHAFNLIKPAIQTLETQIHDLLPNTTNPT